jgi:hypothetical protein
MYDIEVAVTTDTLTELKMTAAWPVIWLQAPGSIEILRKLLPGESLPPLLQDLVEIELRPKAQAAYI